MHCFDWLSSPVLGIDVSKVAGSLRSCEGWCDVEFLQSEAYTLVPLTDCHRTLAVDNEFMPCYCTSPCHMNRLEDDQILIFYKTILI